MVKQSGKTSRAEHGAKRGPRRKKQGIASRKREAGSKKRKASPDGLTEQRLLDAANVVILRRGTAGARMQEIAREAGVNHALLHYYFRTKDQLAAAVFRRAAAGLLPAVVAILASDRPLEEKVTLVIETELDHLTKTPHLPAYIISELAHHPERIHELVRGITGTRPDAIGRSVTGVLGDQIDAAVAAGTMRPIEPAQFVVNLLSMCVFPFAARPMMMAMLGLDEPGFTAFIERRRIDLPRFFLGALRP